jgi:hypothetical protein
MLSLAFVGDELHSLADMFLGTTGQGVGLKKCALALNRTRITEAFILYSVAILN